MKQPDQSDKKGRNTGKPFQAMGLVTAIGVDLAGCTVGGFLLGRWLGGMWGNPSLWIGLGVLFGMVSGAASIAAVIKSVMRDSDE